MKNMTQIIIFKLKNSNQRQKKTKLERYNDKNYNNRNKYKKTNLEKYGTESPIQNKEIKEK